MTSSASSPALPESIRAAAPASGQDEATEPQKKGFSAQFKPRTTIRPRGDAVPADGGRAFPV